MENKRQQVGAEDETPLAHSVWQEALRLSSLQQAGAAADGNAPASFAKIWLHLLGGHVERNGDNWSLASIRRQQKLLSLQFHPDRAKQGAQGTHAAEWWLKLSAIAEQCIA